MNPLSNLTMYDGLCKLCVGLLLIGWIPAIIFQNHSGGLTFDKSNIALWTIFVILSYIVGSMWHHGVTENIFAGLINDNNRIKKAYKKVFGREMQTTFSVTNHPNRYFLAYYKAEKDKMLTIVHILEAFEAFVRDTLLVIPLYAISLPLFLFYKGISCCFCLCLFVILSLLSVVWWFIRNKVQDKIHEAVWETDLYLKLINNPKSSKTVTLLFYCKRVIP